MSENIAEQVREYFKVFPNLTFEQVEGFVEGLTIENFRMIKSRYKKTIIPGMVQENNNNKNNSNYYTIKNVKANFHEQPNKIETLTSDGLEKRIVDALNRQPDNAQILGKAIDFFLKVKTTDGVGMEQLDMEKFIYKPEENEEEYHS